MEKEIFTEFLKTLNEAVDLDREAMQEVCEHRVPCNDALADHPTIQVFQPFGESPLVGTIGLINGICERLTGKRVAGEFDDSGNLIRFVEWKNPSDKE